MSVNAKLLSDASTAKVSLAQCRHDAREWSRQLNDASLGALDFRELVHRESEMGACGVQSSDRKWVAAHFSMAYALSIKIDVRKSVFLNHHRLMAQFLEEDKIGGLR
jgi:hypothetical protein